MTTKAARQAAKRQNTLDAILAQLQELTERIAALEAAVQKEEEANEPKAAKSKSNS